MDLSDPTGIPTDTVQQMLHSALWSSLGPADEWRLISVSEPWVENTQGNPHFFFPHIINIVIWIKFNKLNMWFTGSQITKRLLQIFFSKVTTTAHTEQRQETHLAQVASQSI